MTPFFDTFFVLRLVGRDEFLLNGFRNRDLRVRLFPGTEPSEIDRKRRMARVSHLLRILRAHGLIRKVQHTHRYLVTEHGRTIVKALLRAQDLTLEQLEKIPA